MNKDRVILVKIDTGNFEEGFNVTLTYKEVGQNTNELRPRNIKFPSSPEIKTLYEEWQKKYYSLEVVQRIYIPKNKNTHPVKENDCLEAAKAVEKATEEWFNEKAFQEDLYEFVQDKIGKNEPVRIIFDTDDLLLKKLPWQLLNIFNDWDQAWFSLAARNAEKSQNDRNSKKSQELKIPVKILAVFGGDFGINIEKDESFLKKLSDDADITILKNTNRTELCDNLNNPWDILFFAGHSCSQNEGESGIITLKKQGENGQEDIDQIEVNDLRDTFTTAIKRGLKLAIFNSCDGLGLANSLANLKIPYLLVMREPVPDEVAQNFLEYFLSSFSEGKPLDLAVRDAQRRLERLGKNYPRASWLPVIVQSTSAKSLVWPRLTFPTRLIYKIRKKIIENIPQPSRSFELSRYLRLSKRKFLIMGIIGLLIAILLNQYLNRRALEPINNELFSIGEKFLLAEDGKAIENPEWKQALTSKNWDDVIQEFVNSLKVNKNNPETLIYFNNALAEKKGKKLTIAASIPIGEQSNLSKEILRGIAQAQSEINCGLENELNAIKNQQSIPLSNCQGINGKLLQVQIVNDKQDVTIAKQVAEKIVGNPNIIAVIGHASSKTTLAASEYYQNKIVVVSPTSTSVDLKNKGKEILRTVSSDELQVKSLFAYASPLGKPVKAAIAYDKGDAYSESLKAEFFKQNGKQNFVVECNLFNVDFTAQNCLDKVIEQKAEFLFIAPSAQTNLIRALEIVQKLSQRQQTIKEKINLKVLAGDTVYQINTPRDYGLSSAQTQLVVSVPWHKSDREISKFTQNVQKLWGTTQINWRTVMSYDAAKAIIQGLENIEKAKNKPNRQLLQKQLSDSNFSTEGAIEKVQFTESGERTAMEWVLVSVECRNNTSDSCQFVRLK